MKILLKKRILIISSLVTVISFLTYLLRVSSSVYSADSGDFLAAILSNGVAHPPGYPLYLLLGRMVNFFSFGVATTAWKVGLISALAMAFSSGLLFYLSFLLTKKILPSIIASLSFSFLYSIWTYAEVTEAFSLAVFFVVLISLFSFLAYEDFKNNNKSLRNFRVFCFIFGLALTHHHVVILFIPPLILLFFPYKKKIFTKKTILEGIAFLLLGFSIYLYSYFSALGKPFVNWGDPVDFPNFFRLITRADYGSFTLASFLINQSILARIFQIWPLVYFLYLDWSFLGIFIIFIGIIRGKNFLGRFYWFLIMAFLLFGPFFVFYGALPLSSYFLLGIFERFLIFPNVFLVPFFAVGMVIVTKYLIKVIPGEFSISKKKTFLVLIEAIFILLPLTLFGRNSGRTDFSHFTLGDNLGKAIFESVNENKKAIIFVRGDANIFNTWYYVLERYKKPPSNIAIIPLDLISGRGTITTINKFYPWVRLPKKQNLDNKAYWEYIISTYAEIIPIYITGEIALSNDKFMLIPRGAVWEVVLKDHKFDTEAVKTIYQDFSANLDLNEKKMSPAENFFVKDLILQFCLMHLNYAQYFLENNDLVDAKIAIHNIQKLSLEVIDTHLLLGKIYQKEKKCQEAEKELLLYAQSNKMATDIYDVLKDNAKKCLKDEKKVRFYQKILDNIKATQERPLKEL